ncbi:MAG: hypothetical protein JSR61_01320 [Proteobacteria bacterium]|nr:hypothetical protein [Pseudomonadota bacterium]
MKPWHRAIGAAFAAMAALVLSCGSAPAQLQPPLRLPGTIEKVDGDTIWIRPYEGGGFFEIALDKKLVVFGVTPGTLADLKPGAFIGVGAMPQADGSQRAMRITVFAESQRGLGEGFRPWSRAPGGTMTNATIDTTVAGVDGRTLTVKYKGGEQKIMVPPDVVILDYVSGSRDELKVGAHVLVPSVKRKLDGSLGADRINVGRDGVTPN